MISDEACDCNGEMCHENQVCLKKDDSSFSCEYPCEHPAWDGLQKPPEFLNLETSPDRYHLGKKIQREFRDDLLIYLYCGHCASLQQICTFRRQTSQPCKCKKRRLVNQGILKSFGVISYQI